MHDEELAKWLCRANYLKFEVHLKNLFLIYLLVLVCCDVGVTANQQKKDNNNNHLNTGLVWYSNGQKFSGLQMVRYSKG